MNIKRKIFLMPMLFLAFAHSSVVAQGSWEKVEVPGSQHFRSVFFTDSLYGWISGDSGTLMHTQDGGDSWVSQDAGTDNRIQEVFFLDRQTGWAASWNYIPFFGTLIHKTTDGGDSWTSQPYPEENIFINHIFFFDTQHGWMGGSPHALVRTTDGGLTWTQAAIDTSTLAFFPVLNILFYDEQYGYASGGMFDIAGVTWSTSDGGDSWKAIKAADAPADEVHGLHVFDSITVMGSGGDPELGYGVGMIRSHDGGENWDYDELSIPGAAYDLDFRNDTEAWAPLGPNQRLIYSLDAGATWTRINSPENTSVFDIIFPDSLHGYGVGYNGSFIRYVPVPVGLRESDYNDPHMLIYPNPAVDEITISINGNTVESISLRRADISIVDVFGKTMFQHILFNIPESGQQLKLDVSAYPPGIYLVRARMKGGNIDKFISSKLILW